MAYDENKPQANDELNQSQADLLANFKAIKQLIDVNHETFGVPTDEGKHKILTLTDQSAAPPSSLATEVVLYSNNGDLCLNRASGSEVNFTAATASSSGTTTLPSGIVIKWGLATANGTNQSFPVAFPTNCFIVNITKITSAKNRDSVAVGSKAKTGFTAYTTTANNNWGSASIYYLAIGN